MKKQILLIDDDTDEQEIFAEAIKLTCIEFDCIYANSAKQGIKLLNTLSPDYIFLDVNMPGMNGVECLQELKNKNISQKIPVIIYSTGIDEILTLTVIRMGAAACIKKTDSIESLATILKHVLTPVTAQEINLLH